MQINVIVDRQVEPKEIDTRWYEIKYSKLFSIRSSFACCTQGNMVFLHGGYNTDKGILSDFYQTEMNDDYKERKWSRIQQKGKIKAIKLRNHSLVSFSCYLLCFGGQKTMIDYNSQIYAYDLRYQEWLQCTVESTLSQSQLTSTMSRDSHISYIHSKFMYVFGGYSEGQYKNDLLKFSLEKLNQSKVVLEKLTFANSPSPRASMGFCVSENYLYLFGGANSKSILDDLWTFNLNEGMWKQIQRQKQHLYWPQSRKGSTMSWHHQSDNLFMFGGIQQVTKEKNDVSVYLIKKNKWVKIHSHTDNLFDPSPTLKKMKEESPGVIESKKKKQKRKQDFKLTLKPSKQEKKEIKERYKLFKTNTKYGFKTEISVSKTSTDFRRTNSLSVVKEKKLRQFLHRKKKLLSEVQVQCIKQKRPLSPTSQAFNFSINQMGEQRLHEEKKIDDFPKVIFDQEKGYVIGKKPCARDGHGTVTINSNMYIIGGDRHMVSFNDIHVFKMDKAISSLKYYLK